MLSSRPPKVRTIDWLRHEYPGRWRYSPRAYQWYRSDGVEYRETSGGYDDWDDYFAYRRKYILWPVHGPVSDFYDRVSYPVYSWDCECLVCDCEESCEPIGVRLPSYAELI